MKLHRSTSSRPCLVRSSGRHTVCAKEDIFKFMNHSLLTIALESVNGFTSCLAVKGSIGRRPTTITFFVMV